MGKHDQYGVGLSDNILMGSARNGHYNSYQALIANSENKLNFQGEETPVEKEVIEFNESDFPSKDPAPIFTKNGKLFLIAIILGGAIYLFYKKYKSQQQVQASQPEGQPQIQQQNEATQEAVEAQSGQGEPEGRTIEK